MTTFELVSLLGASAWLPHLYKVAKDYFLIPEVRIIIQKIVEVGYTTYGPILNFRIAFTSKNKDIVISSFKIRLRHESGEEKLLSWHGMVQRMGELRSPEGGASLPWEKESSVLAIKLNQKDIEERLIRFQEDVYHTHKESHIAKIAKKRSYIRGSAELDEEQLLQSEEMKDLVSFVKQWFNWKQGRYEIEFEVESPEKFVLKDNKYHLILTTLDIESLENNKLLVEKSFEDQLRSESPGYESSPILWEWRSPRVEKNSD